ncbi:uroporphyrinogen-III C-methyltransferase [Halalkalibacter sp. APA_J-10(15)]|uniref:uroporphyrinogen-III C-methyltransferase n=1 Tax=Halalkalibacter sp. APA_J-10(15) TaxID=2933805 RepID=UPI001FF119B2|nr:uroporphyrinogen-III C-methyltransferase [Halalkalibacter sp. APA_J-10(15)]MCK0471456.1 uroporphyrinogen-III C-methyltransferase [Halalkalibacter sp. APA_J-10(15)]
MNNGYVYLVGAGPGDIRLMTIKGQQCLEKADVVLYDRLVNPLLLEQTKPDIELVYCGKLPDRHTLRQETIQELLVDYAKKGKIVVRLKGGDPSVYGRVGEEAAALEAAGVQYEIIPGITAGIGASTYAGVPVTHREYGASFAIVTGHDQSKNGQPQIDWKALATGIDTIAFYMGVKNLPYICEQLTINGRNPSTPVMLIQWGTLGKQRVLTGTLQTIVNKVMQEKFTNPAITLVGDVTKLRTKESWFELQPLFSKHILFARTSNGKSTIANQLRDYGADVFEFPRIQMNDYTNEPPFPYEQYEHIIFHAEESVDWFFRELQRKRIDIRSIHASFYGASKKSLLRIQSYACLSYSLNQLQKGGKRLVIGPDSIIKNVLTRQERYGDHDCLISHALTVVHQTNGTCRRLLEEDRIDTIIFPSAESVRVVTEQMADHDQTPSTLSQRAKIICFGPESKKVAEQLGYRVDHSLVKPAFDALLHALQ